MNEKGFTLIEILIAITIAGLILAGVAGLIHQGLNTWENLDRSEDNIQNIRVLEKQLQKDLERLFISDIYIEDLFASSYENLQWLIKRDGQLREIEYFFDSSENSLVRREVDIAYPEGDRSESENTMYFFVEGEIRNVNFSFYDSDPNSDYWRTGSWNFPEEDDYLPSAVRLELDLISDESTGLTGEIEIIAEIQEGREY
ncbi:MAG: PulJ/GspJ family protein [Halanaerobiales bacterium]